LVNADAQPGWCEALYHAKAAELLLYGRALGLSHAEAAALREAQEEIALDTPWGNPQSMAALKRLQRTLGDYCDRNQFRRLARKMKLACCGEMQKEYRRYRKLARAAVRKLRPPQAPATVRR
jgi:hypothetical protein